MVRMVLMEAVGEPYKGQVAVAGVALDRVADERWPNTLAGVIYQPWQFSAMRAKLSYFTPAEITSARRVVASAKAGTRPCGKILWYHNETVTPGWAKHKTLVCQIGNHLFYGD